MLLPDEIRAIELSSFRAWPALVSFDFDGWLLRFAGGLTGRANSVNPYGRSLLPMEEKIPLCERAYTERGLPIRFRLTPAAEPEDLDDVLAGRGYERVAPTSVYTIALPAGGASDAAEVVGTPTSPWEEAKVEFSGFDPANLATWRSIVALIVAPAGFALVRDEAGTPVAVGCAVAQESHLGLFDISVDPGRRGEGWGKMVVDHLLHWGTAQGAATAYLQVQDDNAGAIALYESMGFDLAYPYWYRIRPRGA